VSSRLAKTFLGPCDAANKCKLGARARFRSHELDRNRTRFGRGCFHDQHGRLARHRRYCARAVYDLESSITRAEELQAAIERCKLRITHCQSQLRLFVATMNGDGSKREARQHRKLLDDLKLAGNDLDVLRSMLKREAAHAEG
jgi:hypothetical protein